MRTRVTAGLLALAAAVWGQQRPRDAGSGAALLISQRCIACHSVNGVGGKEAPDLARRSLREYSPSLLASAIWNHAPTMWRAMATRNLPLPKLEPDDVADLFAYFYSLRYFAPPGEAGPGKDIFIARCARCHAREGGPGPPVSKWEASTEPVEWAQQMWNHTVAMTREAEKAGVQWPQLTIQQMVDLMTYVLNAPGTKLRPPTLRVADAGAGEKLFESKNCTRCHTLGGPRNADKIELLHRTERFQTLAEFAVDMWNHAPQMRQRAEQMKIELPTFKPGEMNDLLAYLFDRNYFDEQGNARRGAGVYRAKQCATCHDSGEQGAPKLSQYRGRFSPMFMTSAIWKHGPQMLAAMEKRGLKWPSFTGRQMINLIAYLNSQ